MNNNNHTYFDYDNQAWIVDGVYKACGHSDCKSCFGTINENTAPSKEIQDKYLL